MKRLIIDLHDFDAVTLYNVVDQLKDTVRGENESWTKEYRKVLTKVSTQLSKQLGFEE